MGLFRKKEVKNMLPDEAVTGSVLLSALMNGESITREKAMTIPTVAADVDFISSMIAAMPVRLYGTKSGRAEEITKDSRVRLLNLDTGDTLNAYQMKKAMIEDYLMGRGGYAYVERNANMVTGLYYIKDTDVTVLKNTDPIYKTVKFRIGTREFFDFQILRILRNTHDGAEGKSVTAEINKALQTAYATMIYQLGLVNRGGNKKGFLQSEKHLTKEAMQALKTAWNSYYSNNTENVMVLNDGLKFQESSNSSVEMQLNESKKTLAEEVNGIFHIAQDFDLTWKKAIIPVQKAFENALNSTLLLENEKKSRYFRLDSSELLKVTIKERYEANASAIQNGWKTVNEVRAGEGLNSVDGMDVLNVGLAAVLYDTDNGTYYVPNTGQTLSRDGGNEE